MALDVGDKGPDDDELDEELQDDLEEPEDALEDAGEDDDEDVWDFDAASQHWVNRATGERVSKADWDDATQWEDAGEEHEDEEGEDESVGG